MEYKGYAREIERAIMEIPYGTAIFPEDITTLICQKFDIPTQQVKKMTNVYMKRIADKGDLQRFQRGIYYRAKQTTFGITRPNVDEVVTRILTRQDNEIIGYVTGDYFRNKIGLITLLPKNKEIVTNGYRKEINQNCHVVPKKPITKITRDNYKYLQLIDTIEELTKVYIDAEQPNKILRNYINKEGLDEMQLIYTARKFYSIKTVIRLIDIMAEVEYEITH